jgi:aminodeoxychorismate synthase component I
VPAFPPSALALHEIPSAPGPLAALAALRGRDCPWLLDSALPSSRLSAASFAGAEPWLVLRAQGRRVELECRRALPGGPPPGRHLLDGHPLEVLRAQLPRVAPDETAAGLAFAGGALGFLGYELAELDEALGPAAPGPAELPDCLLLFADRLLAYDHARGRCFAVGLGRGADAGAARRAAEENARAARAWLASPRPAAPTRAGQGGAQPARAPRELGEAHAKAVEEILGEIAAGRVYQACLTHRLEREFRGDPFALYRALRRLNPAPFACYLELPEVAVVGSSPERFLRVAASGEVESRPIKGTRPRGRHPAEDRRLRAELAGSAKDRAENLMIVDLVRNDLGRVCAIGSVAVPELMAIEEYAGVFQMVSTVRGRLREGCDAVDLVRAAFPPGSMTGAPKIAAMRLLRRLEPVRRGVYAGALGYFDARGGADLCVAIRTWLVRGGRAWLHTGGGIVADSEPAAEWQESLDKVGPLLAALEEVEAEGPAEPSASLLSGAPAR